MNNLIVIFEVLKNLESRISCNRDIRFELAPGCIDGLLVVVSTKIGDDMFQYKWIWSVQDSQEIANNVLIDEFVHNCNEAIREAWLQKKGTSK